ncbi:3-oxoacyl-[acyl-carrier-protein] reductase [Laceyella putida]|uniref:3-oxoacyl-[acyl-carrier-protein] reductase n=1 Tax=Laceyella putida TaxID=110101 RepID=A0ABW2RHL2_9BACL
MSDPQHVLVTGGARGIGRGIVEDLASRGIKVTFLYRGSQELAERLVAGLHEQGGDVSAYPCDVRRSDAVKEAIATILDREGPVDGLVNNAGITRDALLFMMKDENWADVIETNLYGVYHVTRHLISHFLRRKQGRVVNITSVAGLVGIMGQTNYCASKAGIIGFTKSLALEVAKQGITVNAVAPGYIDTEMVANLPEAKREELLKRVPMGRIGTVRDVAGVVRFLLGDESRYMTGQVITLDGGLTV